MSCRSLSTQYLKSSKRALSLLEQPWLTTSHFKQIQSHLTVTGSISDPFAAGRLITAAHTTTISTPSAPAYAHRIFLLLPRRTPYIWNAVIRAFTESSQPAKSLSLYKDMIGSGFLPNNYTFSFVIRAAVDVSDITLGSALHAQAIRLGWESYDFVKNGLIHLYVACKCDCDSVGIVSARKLFDESCSSRDVVTWTALINGYVKAGQIHAALELFDRMPVRNAVSWGAMITGCAQGELFEEALELFNEMQVSGVRPTHAAIVGALTACAFLGALDQGRWIHAYVLRRRSGNDGASTGTDDLELDTKLGTALVDMYAKCGCIEVAEQVFEEIRCKDVYAFTSMISGLSNNGQSVRSIEVFERMQVHNNEENPGRPDVVEPNSVSFLCALSACSRIGWVEKGLSIFKRMRSPGREHYGCVVDLLGRAGFVREAVGMVREMPMEPDCYVLGALLNAFRLHGDAEVGKETVRRLMEEQQQQQQKMKHGSGFQTLLSNIYASAKQWERVEYVRSGMGEKMPGCSSIKVSE